MSRVDLRTQTIGANLGRRPRELSMPGGGAWVVSACDVCGEPGLLVRRVGRRAVYAHAFDGRGFTDIHTRASAYWNFGTTETGKRMRALTTSSDWEILSARAKTEIRLALDRSIVPSFATRSEIDEVLAEKLKWPPFELVDRLAQTSRMEARSMKTFVLDRGKPELARLGYIYPTPRGTWNAARMKRHGYEHSGPYASTLDASAFVCGGNPEPLHHTAATVRP